MNPRQSYELSECIVDLGKTVTLLRASVEEADTIDDLLMYATALEGYAMVFQQVADNARKKADAHL